MTNEEFNASLTAVVAERFSRVVVGAPRAMSEYHKIYSMLRIVIVRTPDDVEAHVEHVVDCTPETLLGGFAAWLDKLKVMVPGATTIVWRRMPEYTRSVEVERDCEHVKLYARAHVLTEAEFVAGPVEKPLDG